MQTILAVLLPLSEIGEGGDTGGEALELLDDATEGGAAGEDNRS